MCHFILQKNNNNKISIWHISINYKGVRGTVQRILQLDRQGPYETMQVYAAKIIK